MVSEQVAQKIEIVPAKHTRSWEEEVEELYEKGFGKEEAWKQIADRFPEIRRYYFSRLWNSFSSMYRQRKKRLKVRGL